MSEDNINQVFFLVEFTMSWYIICSHMMLQINVRKIVQSVEYFLTFLLRFCFRHKYIYIYIIYIIYIYIYYILYMFTDYTCIIKRKER